MSSKKVWGELIRCGGSEESAKVPSMIALTDNPTFFGRLTHPQQGGSVAFTHTSQFVIECLFISSTHFSIACETNDAGETEYKVYDFSRNGTFLDGVLIGSTPRTMANGAEISLRYKDKVKIAYRFNALSDSNFRMTSNNNVASSISGPQPSSPSKAKRPEIDNATTALTQQIAMLQEEIRKLESKCSSQEEQNETLKKEFDAANRKLRQSDKQIEQHQRELSEAKERITVAEANASAIQARVINLENDLEEAEVSMKEQRSKIASLQDDIKSKNEQLETLRKMISDGNQALAEEQTTRKHTETTLQEITEQLEQSANRNQRLLAANQALQSLVVQQEEHKTRLQEHLSTHRAMIIAIQQRVEEQSRLHHNITAKLHDLLQLFGQVDTSAQKLVQISDKQLLRDIEEFLSSPELIISDVAEAAGAASTIVGANHITNNANGHNVFLSAGSLPNTNPVIQQTTTLTSTLPPHQTQYHINNNNHFPSTLPPALGGSEDSSVSKRGFNFTQVPYSGIHDDDDEAATYAPSKFIQDAIMEVDNEDEDNDEDGDKNGSSQGENRRNAANNRKHVVVKQSTIIEGTDDEQHEDNDNDDHEVDGMDAETQIPTAKVSSKGKKGRVQHIESPFPKESHITSTSSEHQQAISGIILSQESNVRKTGSTPSKSDIREEDDEEEHLYTSTPAPPHVTHNDRKRGHHHGSSSQEDDNETNIHLDRHDDDDDGPRVKRIRAEEETTFIVEENPSFISPPKSFDISRDLMMTRDEDDINNAQIMELREEDRQRTVDTTINTASRLDVSGSDDE